VSGDTLLPQACQCYTQQQGYARNLEDVGTPNDILALNFLRELPVSMNKQATIAALSALFLVACGGGGGGGSPSQALVPDPATPAAAPPAPAPAPAPVASAPAPAVVAPAPAPVASAPAPAASAPAPTASAPAPAPAPASSTTYGDLRKASLGIGAPLNGTLPFPANNAWNTDISNRPVDPNSANIVASIGGGTGLHPDFGTGNIGIPYMVVSGAQAKVPMIWTAYGAESDPGPYPIPSTAPIEGGGAAPGDRHVLVIDRDNNRLYEIGNSFYNTNGSWSSACGAIFFLDSNNVRPGGQPGWTSADAAGLPIFPGLVRYDEVAAGVIKHALRFTVQASRRAYVPPANHWASSQTNVNLPPMGARLRLKASYVIPSNYSREAKIVLQALKTYGMIVADNGSNWFITGAPDDRWNDTALHDLTLVKGSNFEVVQMDGLVHP
jgi:hypothetical protein